MQISALTPSAGQQAGQVQGQGQERSPAKRASFVRPRGRVAEEQAIPDGPPLQRLTSSELREISAQWRALAQRGDEAAERVALALEWVAAQRARKEPTRAKVLAERISQWMGL
ncbi:hypothetical protein QTH91_02020 [Variovorax dokdonensis]|uniref:Uncharacterized protein n=1 Tax=Variovorax dokdonensis TaxID=344883 RepID=A0ABT7N5L9_9BURK|nr:hypothetical protein [Variovorax dokdonensis]MDM0043249.1 hypothetical protein [Variovorax dokdonensis]